MDAKGKVFKYGDNIDTDVIIAARFLNSSDPEVLAAHCMEEIDPDFRKNVKKGDIVVAKENFGCGSSREHAPIALRECGISLVIAASFGRIFFRNAIDIGLPLMECKEASEKIEQGDEVEVDFSSGVIKNLTKNEEYQATPFPKFIQDLLNAGGLVNFVRNGGFN